MGEQANPALIRAGRPPFGQKWVVAQAPSAKGGVHLGLTRLNRNLGPNQADGIWPQRQLRALRRESPCHPEALAIGNPRRTHFDSLEQVR
jgi:hypothetical protein